MKYEVSSPSPSTGTVTMMDLVRRNHELEMRLAAEVDRWDRRILCSRFLSILKRILKRVINLAR